MKLVHAVAGHPAVDEVNSFANRSLRPKGATKLAEQYLDGRGQVRVKGTKALKASQAYPRKCFGLYLVVVLVFMS